MLNSSVAVDTGGVPPPKAKADAEVPAPANPSLPTFKLPTVVQLDPFQDSVKFLAPGPPPKIIPDVLLTPAAPARVLL